MFSCVSSLTTCARAREQLRGSSTYDCYNRCGIDENDDNNDGITIVENDV